MGFRPVDDSDLDPKSKRRTSEASEGGKRSGLKSTGGERKRGDSGAAYAKRSGRAEGMRQADFEGENDGKKRKNKKKKTTAWTYVGTFFKVFGATAAVFVVVVGVIVYCSMAGWLGDVGAIDLKDIGVPSEVYYIDSKTGQETHLATLSEGENQKWVGIDDIPKDMQHAFVAVEDERFYEHSGVDLLSTGKATFQYVIGQISGSDSISRGGSTITQQLVKNIENDWDPSPARKLREMSKAVNVEKQLSKEEILELYLNVINLSNGCYGVQSASMKIFGRPVDELNLAECACIAGITQNPTYYDPLKNPKNNKTKQEIVLEKMLDQGYINQEEYKEAKSFKLVFNKKDDEKDKEYDDYYIEYLKEKLVAEYESMGYSHELAVRRVSYGGLKIITTVDPKVQDAIDSIYASPSEAARIFGYNASDSNSMQSAIVIVDPYTGGIKGMSGGLGVKSGNLVLNRVKVARQPGSSIKPIAVYAPALENKIIHASTVYNNVTEDFGNGFKPKNSTSMGPTATIKESVQRSSNVVACRVVKDLGVNKSYSFLENKLGISTLSEDDKNLSALALGGMTRGVSPIEMAGAYTIFVNDGVYTEPYIFTKVYDREGNLIIEHTPKKNQAVSEETAYIMAQLMRYVVTSGTGSVGGGTQIQANGESVFTAGKTGTTDDNYDKWFVGFSPNYVCAVWSGYDRNKVIGRPYGSMTAFREIMSKIHKDETIKSISAPDGIKMYSVCSSTGDLASSGCNSMSLPFTADNKPRSYCKYCKNVNYDDSDKEDENSEDNGDHKNKENSDGAISSKNDSKHDQGFDKSEGTRGEDA